MSIKKRRNARVEMDIPGEFRAGEKDPREPCSIGNLGPEGAFVKTEQRVAAGAKVRLSFRISSHPLPFDVEAEVRWLREGADGGLGVLFVDFPPYDRAALDDFCQHRLDESRGAAASPAS